MLGYVKCPFEPQFHETAVVELNRGVEGGGAQGYVTLCTTFTAQSMGGLGVYTSEGITNC